MKLLAVLLACALPAAAQWDEDVLIVSGTNGAAAVAEAPELFVCDWAAREFAPLRQEWERIGRDRPRQFPSIWSADARALIPWQGSVTATLAAADAPDRRPAMHRLRQLLGKKPTEKNVQRALLDLRAGTAAAGGWAAAKTNVVQFMDILLADRATAAEVARK